jgi:hypothetical protein
MAVLTVGAGQRFPTLAAAVASAQSGDMIEIQAGTYRDDFATIRSGITIRAVGGLARLVAERMPRNGKAILITTGNVTLSGLAFSGARVPDKNGAGIRYEGGDLTVVDCEFHDNQDGLLGGRWPEGTVTVRRCVFSANGAGDGRTHGLYIGRVKRLVVEDSHFHDTRVGHHIKSRAHESRIVNNQIQDRDGTASYSIDLPNGGVSVVAENVIQQGPQSQNPAIVHFGGEGRSYETSSLLIERNIVINGLASPSSRLLLNHTDFTATLRDNVVFGLTPRQIASGPAEESGTIHLPSLPSAGTAAP